MGLTRLGLCAYPLSLVVLILVAPLRRVTFAKRRKSNQKVSLLCPALLRRVPSLRPCSAGTRRTGIHALAALARHPCRAPGYATPALGLPKSHFVALTKSRHDTKPVGANSFARGRWCCDKAQPQRPKAEKQMLLIFTHASPNTAKRDLGAGRTQAARSGQRGMDAALAAPGHGWPMAACPRSVAGVREPDEVGPNREQERFGYFRLGRLPALRK